ncbi:MAG: ABC transporter substrate-binding protein [Bacteroidetes bacterium]|nr:ABC transporter substrate-binding protein [Bacteroidota bacterium]
MHRILLLALVFLAACTNAPQQPASDATALTWEQVLQQAQGSTVHLMMWQGDPLINAYMQRYVAPAVKEQFGISLEIASGQGNAIVQTLMTEMEAGKTTSELDLMWINGETFYQLRQVDALFGPWTDRLPNAQLIDFQNPFINTDFQQPVDGYECPWGNVQMTLIYNSEFVKDPPRRREALAAFVKAHPGKFTFDTQFTGLTFLKSLLIDIAGGGNALDGAFDEKKYQQTSAQLWAYLREIQPYLWKEGKTFPDSRAPMHQLFSNGELWFSLTNNDNEVDSKVRQGLFPPTARAYVPDFGSIQNSHYMGIPKLSGNKAGAAVVANFLISPEAQLEKQKQEVWGDGTVLDLDKLPAEWKPKFESLAARQYAPPRSELQKLALRELAPEYMIRLAKDFREQIIEQ